MRNGENVSPRLLVHVAEAEVELESGMGRIAWHWREAFVRRGWEFVHIGPGQTRRPWHKALWPLQARQAYRQGGRTAALCLAHEPAAETMRRCGLPTVLFSHGIESRGAEALRDLSPGLTLRQRLLRPFWSWRERMATLGLRRSQLLLLSSRTDAEFAVRSLARRAEDVFVFRNGVDPSGLVPAGHHEGRPTVLFYASWVLRKGTRVLVEAARALRQKGVPLKWLLAGTARSREEILREWPVELHDSVEVIPRLTAAEDEKLFERADIFVLPSYYEGQPLTLLQAMASGRCVITTDCCGQRDVIRHRQTGLLFPPGDVHAFVDLIAECAIKAELRFSLGAAAQDSVRDRTWSVVADEVVDRVEQLMRVPAPA